MTDNKQLKSLEDPVDKLKGVGPKKAKALNKLGISTINDLLEYYPIRYEDFSIRGLTMAKDGEKITVKGDIVTEPRAVFYGRHKSRITVKLAINDNEIIELVFFNQPWLKKRLSVGQKLIVYGKWNLSRRSLSVIKTLDNVTDSKFSANYASNKEIKQQTIAQLVKLAFDEYQDVIYSILPDFLIQKYKLMDRKTMIHNLHFPKNQDEVTLAKRTAVFEEFFLFEMRLQMAKAQDKNNHGLVIEYNNEKLKQFISKLPFELTNDQKRVVNEICFDLKRPIHMNRLLQGDVGSGKTIVAAIAMYAAITGGYQAALMAPTEILAEQHAKNLAEIFADCPVNIVLMTGSLKSKIRKNNLLNIKNGEFNLIIGTHALISDDVEYHNLGLVIIDEQHRFGVEQRKALRQKGMNPDILSMTATPIPRTLQITAYGEMDVSLIKHLPAGRKPIQTRWLHHAQTPTAINFILKELAKGRQAFIVTPLIEESETLDVQNATAVYEKIKTDFAPKFKVGLLHGRMKDDEKSAVMQDFKKQKYDVLVSTTVIEVGIDIPNASVMLILDADRFGLSQLHQLRGRIGRGEYNSTCIVVADPKTQYGIKRMETIVKVSDGFTLAQKDLELRGPGDVLGTKQTGVPDFKIGDPVKQINILQIAQQEAISLINQPGWEKQPENRELVGYENYLLKKHSMID